ncbi:MAG: hypothetical protein KBC98_01345 [Candidatus Pacebacteria bacterium]|nr:hypothetical protein [Candidatus Paceibacterota bacterium]
MKRKFLELAAASNLAITKSLQQSFDKTQGKYDELSPILIEYEKLEEVFLGDVLAALESKITSPELKSFLLDIPGESGKSLLRFLVEGALTNSKGTDMSHSTFSREIDMAGFSDRQDFIPALQKLDEAWGEIASIGCNSDVKNEFVKIELKLLVAVASPV